MIIEYEALNGRTGHEAGRALLRRMYARHIGGRMPQILTGERGKPYFAQGNVHFSISHTKSHVFCVLADRPVGIDAEELDRAVSPRRAATSPTPGPSAFSHAAEVRTRALLTFWVLKEAAAKMSGEGLRGYPDHTNFALTDPRVTEIDICLVAVITEGGHHAF